MNRYDLHVARNQFDEFVKVELAPNGGWVMYQDAAARIAELEAAIYQYVNHVVSYEGTSFIDEMNEPPWAKLINDTWVKQAALAGGKKDEATPSA